MSIITKIDSIEEAIFNYEIADTANDLVGVFTEIVETGVIGAGDSSALSRFNALMGKCLAAMQNRDYLLLADLMEYQLKPMIGG